MHSNGHVRFGGRAGETGREQFRYCAPARPYVSVRRYPGGKLLIKPSKAAIRRIRERLAAETRALRGANAMAVIVRLSPIIRGWAAYYRTVVSAEVFSALDHYVWQLTYKWATYSHPNKPKRWIVGRYFGKFSKSRNDHWVFGHRESGGHLVKFSWTRIDRHVIVKGGASPDDPALADYWATRRRRSKPPLDDYTLSLLTRQNGLCSLCGDHLLTAASLRNPRSSGNDGGFRSPARR